MCDGALPCEVLADAQVIVADTVVLHTSRELVLCPGHPALGDQPCARCIKEVLGKCRTLPQVASLELLNLTAASKLPQVASSQHLSLPAACSDGLVVTLRAAVSCIMTDC